MEDISHLSNQEILQKIDEKEKHNEKLWLALRIALVVALLLFYGAIAISI